MKLHNAKKAVECSRIERLFEQIPEIPRPAYGAKLNRYRVKFRAQGEYSKDFSRIVKAPTPELAAEEIRLLHGASLKIVSVTQR